LNLAQALGRPALGLLSDKLGRLNMAIMSNFLTCLLCFLMWPFITSYASIIVFAILLGILFGAVFTIGGPVAAETVPLQDLSSCLSMMWLLSAGPAAVAEPIALELRKKTGNEYLNVIMLSGCMYFGSSACMLYIRWWKIQTRDKSSLGVCDDSATPSEQIQTKEGPSTNIRSWFRNLTRLEKL